ncbi:MAG TPA: hypothetical protein VF975_05820, partial [Thermoanaerobaculia bacterium]
MSGLLATSEREFFVAVTTARSTVGDPAVMHESLQTLSRVDIKHNGSTAFPITEMLRHDFFCDSVTA